MVTSDQCFKKYGKPDLQKSMNFWAVPLHIKDAITVLPSKVYCNKDMNSNLEIAFDKVISRNLSKEIVEWNGCFNIRYKRGGTTASLHSWGIAIDINAKTNAFGTTPTMSKELVDCFTSSGFDWGGVWHKADGMHFQLSKI